jgi:hypothetical protein
MPTFVYLSGRKQWLNMDRLVSATDETPKEGTFAGLPVLCLWLAGGEPDERAYNLTGPDREVFLKALAKFTMPKE